MKTKTRAKTYYYCTRDHNGQRTGNYQKIKLKPEQIQVNEYGLKYYRFNFLYESEHQVNLACQS